MNNAAATAGACLDAALAIILEKESELARLDAVAGDGDHGAGMARGFRAAVAAAADRSGTPGQVLAQAGAAFSNAAGGASGALVGMFIMTVGNNLTSPTPDARAVYNALTAGVAALARLGKAQLGDKTMLDTLMPFVEAYGAAVEAGAGLSAAWQQALPAAAAGRDSTKDMVSKRGRSAVLKEKSLGHLDPGAASMYYVLEAVGGVLAERCP
ncbi:MAG: dihydroxyacetone kinase subunit DhaL [Aggregatilineales bacterium]